MHSVPRRVLSGVALVTLAAGLVAIAAANGRATVESKPSAAAAKRATRTEVTLRYGLLNVHTSHHPVALEIRCGRVAKLLYRCSFFGETASPNLYVYVLNGRATVRFGPSGARTTLHGVACSTYALSNIPYDFC